MKVRINEADFSKFENDDYDFGTEWEEDLSGIDYAVRYLASSKTEKDMDKLVEGRDYWFESGRGWCIEGEPRAYDITTPMETLQYALDYIEQRMDSDSDAQKIINDNDTIINWISRSGYEFVCKDHSGVDWWAWEEV